MITTGFVAAAFFFLVVLTLLAVVEQSLSRASKVSTRRLLEKSRSQVTQQLKQMVDERLERLVSVYVGIQLCTVFLAIIITAYLHNLSQNYAEALLAAFGIMFLIVVLFRQLVPRLVAYRQPEQMLLALIPIYNLCRPMLALFSYPLSSTLKLLAQRKPQEEAEKTEEHLEEEIQAYLDVGTEQGFLKKEEEQLFQSVVEFGDTVAGRIMTPRMEMVTIEISATLGQLKQLMMETKYSRIPAYRSHAENIEGFVYLKDVIDIWDGPAESRIVERLLRPILFVPETKSVAELLKELQHKASHMAIVVDEFGGVAGLVTIEDILEEIAGEIHDEDEAADIVQISQDAEGRYLLPGNTALHEVEELFSISFQNEDNTTIGGFVSSALGRVPRKGEKYIHQGVQFEVKEADRRRIRHLLASQVVPLQSQNPDAAKE
jgi:putative hemolysin